MTARARTPGDPHRSGDRRQLVFRVVRSVNERHDRNRVWFRNRIVIARWRVRIDNTGVDKPEKASGRPKKQGDTPAYGDIIVEGQLATQSYYMSGTADSVDPMIFDFRAIEPSGDTLQFSYPESESWAVLYVGIFGIAEHRPVLDFSPFDKLVLDLKRESGAKTLTVHIKDLHLPDSVAPETIELRLSDEWTTHEIDLSDFAKTNTSKLVVPIGFTFFKEAQSFSLRNARYLKAE